MVTLNMSKSSAKTESDVSLRQWYWKIKLSQDCASNPMTNQTVGMFQRKENNGIF